MKIRKLGNIKKFYFSYEDIARALSISLPSARVIASRYVRQGFLVRVKKLDLASLDFSKLDMVRLERMSKKFPQKTRKLLEKSGYLKKA